MYFESQVNNNITYSIDMLRLKTYITYEKFTEIEFRFKTVWTSFVKKFYTSAGFSSFFYNYNIEVGEGQSFYFGFLHNTEKRSTNTNKLYNFTIEFNPNKIKDNHVLIYLLEISGEWFIKSCDFAFDVPINILNILYDRGLKRKIHTWSNGFDDKTYTIGSRGSQGYIKIYNKKNESNLIIPGDLTRIEYTKIFDDFPLSKIKLLDIKDDDFPIIYTLNYIYTFDDYKDKTLLAVLYAVQSGFEINMLTRQYRKKIKNLLEGDFRIKFDKTTATQIFHRVLFRYFMKNDLVRWF